MVDWVVTAAVAEVLAAVATVAAVAWAGYEFHRTRLAELDARVAEIEAVTMEIAELIKPNPSEVHEALGVFVYTFELQNPGRLPLTDVSVHLKYPGPVQRMHSDAAKTRGESKDVHEMYTPSVAAHGTHRWRRQLVVPEKFHDQMRKTTAEIGFTTADAGAIVVNWPSVTPRPSNALRRRLRPENLRDSTPQNP